MSTKKQGGKLTQQKRTNPKFLGVKVSGGETVSEGNVLIRQRGSRYKAGKNVSMGRDHTLYASAKGDVRFTTKLGRKFVNVENG